MDRPSNPEQPICCKFRIDRISLMENIFSHLNQYLHANGPDLTDPCIRSLLATLAQYYESPEWKEDYAADERGELPPNLKRGVLSQDGVYNLLTDIFPEGNPPWVYEETTYGI